ncbi:MAG: lipoyl(octanoyl) transferase LipB [Cellvibrionaceae bacterium]
MPTLLIRNFGRANYEPVWQAMQAFTDNRDKDDVETPDELWIVEHNPVFTQGQAGKAEHLLNTGDIPVVQVDRGGQVTYHGPGQLVAYPMFNLRRLGIGVRDLVSGIENVIVETLKQYGIESAPKADAPGVYVNGDKIASLGLRVRRGCSFHGLALNIDMDLTPWQRINPCGYPGLEMVQMQNSLGDKTPTWNQVSEKLVTETVKEFHYDNPLWLDNPLDILNAQ